MGWLERDAGMWGDEPADAFGGAVRQIESTLPNAPTVEELLASLIVALNCDGQREQLFRGDYLIYELKVPRGDEAVRICADHARPELVAPLYDAVDAASEAYRELLQRPPTISELLQYLEIYADADHSEPIVSNPGPWRLSAATVVHSKKRKSPDRLECPVQNSRNASAPRRVRHARFGVGTVVGARDDSLEVRFDDGQLRTIRRTFLTEGESG